MDQMKNEFISTVSHELRTPLTSIKGSLGLISGGVAGNISPDTRHLVNIAEKNTERLLLFINDLLDMEKIESGKMDFNFDKLSVKSLIVRAIEVNSGYAKEHNITFLDISSDDDDDDDDVFVFADDDRLMQVMSNLMSNAAKFSPDGDVVEINTYRKGKIICISVTDRGPGIPEGFHSRIFKKFSQSDSSDTRKVGGTGLGLSICKVIIEKHNGHIGFNSVEGKGASFYIELSEEKLDSNNSYQQQLRQADA
jgi:signal transduction histidine kinase